MCKYNLVCEQYEVSGGMTSPSIEQVKKHATWEKAEHISVRAKEIAGHILCKLQLHQNIITWRNRQRHFHILLEV
jgi:hypothetical protein